MADNIPFVEAMGTNYEIGCQLGEHSKDVLPRFLNHKKALEDRQKILAEPRILSQSLRAAAARYPRFMDELRGIADGAGVAFQDLFLFNWRPRPRRTGGADGCTTLIVPKPDRVLIAHNEDWYAGANDVFLARLKSNDGRPGGPAARLDCLAVCYHGFLPGLSASINRAGLAQTLNNVISGDCGAGIPLTLIDRAALEATCLDEAIAIATQAGRADSENFNLAQANRAIIVETTAADFEVTEVAAPTVHTNHLLAPRLRPLEASPRRESTLARHARATKMLTGLDDPSLDDLRAILSDHEGAPWSICRHDERDSGATLATILIDTSERALVVCHGPPCRSAFHTFTL